MPGKSIERVLSDVEIGKLAPRAVETLKNLGVSIQSIRTATTERVGFEERGQSAEARQACRRDDELPARRADEAQSLARAVAEARLAGPAGAAPDAAPAATPAAFASRAEVDAALASALGYSPPPSRPARRFSSTAGARNAGQEPRRGDEAACAVARGRRAGVRRPDAPLPSGEEFCRTRRARPSRAAPRICAHQGRGAGPHRRGRSARRGGAVEPRAHLLDRA